MLFLRKKKLRSPQRACPPSSLRGRSASLEKWGLLFGSLAKEIRPWARERERGGGERQRVSNSFEEAG